MPDASNGPEAAGQASPRFTRLTPEARRREILTAARRCLGREGMRGFTVAEIAAEANISNGLIGHYFPTKDALLIATYEAEAERLIATTRKALAASRNHPDSRIVALVESAFAEEIFDRETVALWLALWGQVYVNPGLREAHKALYADYRRGFDRALSAAAAERGLSLDTKALALDICALIDGLWLQWCLDPELFDRAGARQACYRLLAVQGLTFQEA